MARLPTPGQDAGSWGTILNQYLLVEHNADGTLKRGSDIDQALSATVDVVHKGDITLDIQDYGASPDNPDNKTAIQAAIDAAHAAGGGEVTSGNPVTYVTSPGIQVKAGVRFRNIHLKLIDNCQVDDNILKSEAWSDVLIENVTIDGNRNAQPGHPGPYTHTQYGLYLGGVSNSIARNVTAKNTTGVGIHTYNCVNVTVTDSTSTNNFYHGFEVEQCVGCHYSHVRGYANDLHGMLVSPGEVGGSGSKANNITNFGFDGNGQYGIAFNAANDDISAFLCEGNTFAGGSVTNNAHYGISLYKQDKQQFTNVFVSGNGYFGIHCNQSANNVWSNVLLRNNSQSGPGAYDEIMLEGAANGHASSGNLFTQVKIIIDSANNARYGIHEQAADDSNTYIEIDVIGNPVLGATNLSSASRFGHVNLTTAQNVGGLKNFSEGIAVAANATLPGGKMGLDAPFGNAAFRMFSDVGNLQYVAPNGNADWYIGGNNTFSVTSQRAIAQTTLNLATSSPPTSPTDGGQRGDVAWDENFIYLCTAANTWKRAGLSPW